MPAGGSRLTFLAVAAAALALPACSKPLVVSPAPEPAPPAEAPPPPRTATPAPPAGPTFEPGQPLPAAPDADPGSDEPTGWDQLRFDYGLAFDDIRHMYSPTGLAGLALGIGVAAPLANTSADRSVNNWYKYHVRDSRLDGLAGFGTYAGQLWVVAPVGLEVAGLYGLAGDDYQSDGGLFEWSNRALRAIAVGYPPLLAEYVLLGSSRPDRNDSRWHPFQDTHGASGHTFIGAVPFLTAAAMTDEPLLKAPLVLGSFLTGWARLHDDRHYFSQIVLGWWMAVLSVHTVGQTQAERAAWTVAPTVTPDGAGLAVHVRY
jgi:hypothetical protein